MPARKVSCTDAAGVVHTRKTVRDYSHAVAFLPSIDAALRWSDCDWKSDGSNFEYWAKIAAGNDPHPTRSYRDDPARWSAEEIAESLAWAAAQNAERIADAQARTAGHDRASYIAAQRAARVAIIREKEAAGYYQVWQIEGWCGRRDLAQKLAGKIADKASRVEILEASY